MLADETNLRWLYPWIFIIGELSLLGSEETEESILSKIHVKRTFVDPPSLFVGNKTIALLQSLTTYSLPTLNSQQESVKIPSPISCEAHRTILYRTFERMR